MIFKLSIEYWICDFILNYYFIYKNSFVQLAAWCGMEPAVLPHSTEQRLDVLSYSHSHTEKRHRNVIEKHLI